MKQEASRAKDKGPAKGKPVATVDDSGPTKGEAPSSSVATGGPRPTLSAVKRTAFMERVQTDKQTIEELAAKLLELAHDAYTDMESTAGDAEAADQFRKGISEGLYVRP